MIRSNPIDVHKDGAIYMNPGYSQVRDYIVNGIKEVVQKYDVDGVQFDDYFYPFNEFGGCNS